MTRPLQRLLAFVFLLVILPTSSAFAQDSSTPQGVIAYSTERAAPPDAIYVMREIFTINPDGSNPTQITTTGPDFDNVGAAWSPDGTQIAFVSDRFDDTPMIMGDANYELIVMNADGSNPRRLTNDPAVENHSPSWSPDGTQIAYVAFDGDGNSSIVIIGADGTNPHTLDIGDTKVALPAWSPDGTQIVYESRQNGPFDLYVVNTDGTNAHKLLADSSGAEFAAWSPDGGQIAYTAYDGVNSVEVWVVNADGSNPHMLTDSDLFAESPSWSPDGSQIVFAYNNAANGDYQLYVVNSDGTDSHVITPDDTTAKDPAWGNAAGGTPQTAVTAEPTSEAVAEATPEASTEAPAASETGAPTEAPTETATLTPTTEPTVEQPVETTESTEEVKGGDSAPTATPTAFSSSTEPTVLSYGDTITGALAVGVEDHYTFTGSHNDQVTITLVSTDFDPVLELQDSDGNSIGYSDDADGRNSRIEMRLPADGVYTLVARSFAGAGEGSYTLSINLGAVADTSATPSATRPGSTSVLRQWASSASATSEYSPDSWSASQAVGAPNTTDCGDATTAWASAEATGRDVLTVYFDQPVRAQQVNIYETYTPGSIIRIELLPANGGTPVNVNTGRDRTECPGVFSIDVSGVDVGLVNGVNIILDQSIGGTWNEIDAVELVGTTDGSTIPAATRTAVPSATPSAAPFATQMVNPPSSQIAYGDTISDTLTIGTPDEYTFTGSAGDSISIAMNADFDTYLELYDASGDQVAANDDFIGLDSQIDIVLPTSGAYTIIARSFANASGGDYTLSLTLSGGATDDTKGGGSTSSGGGSIEYGETVNGQLSGAAQDYTFTGGAGDFVVITLDSPDFDTYLILSNSDGQEVTHNDDFNGLNSQITTTLPSGGTYHITVRGFSSSAAGEYTLSLTGGDAESMGLGGSIEYGQTVEGVLSGLPQDYAFTGSAGDSVTITLNSPDFDTYLILTDSNGQEISRNDDFNGLNSQITVALPGDDTYHITVRGFSSSAAGDFTLALTHGGGGVK